LVMLSLSGSNAPSWANSRIVSGGSSRVRQ
jgi:hypothetical protein